MIQYSEIQNTFKKRLNDFECFFVNERLEQAEQSAEFCSEDSSRLPADAERNNLRSFALRISPVYQLTLSLLQADLCSDWSDRVMWSGRLEVRGRGKKRKSYELMQANQGVLKLKPSHRTSSPCSAVTVGVDDHIPPHFSGLAFYHQTLQNTEPKQLHLPRCCRLAAVRKPADLEVPHFPRLPASPTIIGRQRRTRSTGFAHSCDFVFRHHDDACRLRDSGSQPSDVATVSGFKYGVAWCHEDCARACTTVPRAFAYSQPEQEVPAPENFPVRMSYLAWVWPACCFPMFRVSPLDLEALVQSGTGTGDRRHEYR
ncbi:hypothetical protein EGW08_005850 [Elysia chlorotica]|uniref:Uncharacterized protein n=1 Tax=Elysia chlorotica TaxID=188477 RepID=A0A3S0ZTL6_ELYCH|nr:hypothetical protein EGW08_005850 [Elysia chlorotica]